MVAFNEPVSAESLGQVTLEANGTSVSLTPTLSNGNQTLTLVPVAGLSASNAYTLTVAGVTDLSGNAMAAAFTSTFTTSAQADLRAPVVATFDTANGVTGVPLNGLMRVGFNKAMDALSVGATNLEVYPLWRKRSADPRNGVDLHGWHERDVPPDFQSGSRDAVLFICERNRGPGRRGLSLRTTRTLSCFTTSASTQTTGPVVTGVSPSTGSMGVPVNGTVQVALSEPVSAVSVGNSAIALSAGGQPVAGTVAVGNGSTTLDVHPHERTGSEHELTR